MRGQVVAGRYELTSPIGRGGMGEVWAAYDTRLDRRVALKLLRRDLVPAGSEGRTTVACFRREARLTARLEHPGVPAVFDVGAEGDLLFLVMQLVDGQDLGDVLGARGALPVEWAVAIAAQIAAVLAAAHAISLVHRDLKPRNVMLARGGTVRVLDFGVAALLDPEITRVTAVGETVGSPAYMAPEQITSGTASPRTDLYALGCVLHEMLAGTEVFGGSSPAAQMYAHLERRPAALRTVRPEVPPEVERLVLDLLAKDPEARPGGAEEVYERLAPLLPVGREKADADALDPTRPYRQPFVPAPRSARPHPATPPAEPLSDVRERAAELAEAGRFTQAAELLGQRLRGAVDAPGQLLGARLQLAHTLLLGGEFARALPEFRALAGELAARRGPRDETVLQCHVQISTCLAELGALGTAVEELTAVLQVREEAGTAADTEALDLRRQLALLMASAGDLDGARRVIDDLVADAARALGVHHPITNDARRLAERLAMTTGRGPQDR